MSAIKKPLALIILDGWGSREKTSDNAIANAHTPVLDELFNTYPSTLISSSGEDVGLPPGQMGNSEVGHLNIGSGRIVFQELSRIDNAIADGSFNHNEVLINSLDKAINQDKAIHIMGLLSEGGVAAAPAGGRLAGPPYWNIIGIGIFLVLVYPWYWHIFDALLV